MSSMTAADSGGKVVREIGRKWWAARRLFGASRVGLCIVLMFKPGKSVHAIAVIIGIWLLIVVSFGSYRRSAQRASERGSYLWGCFRSSSR